jgi:hypothetical protein
MTVAEQEEEKKAQLWASDWAAKKAQEREAYQSKDAAYREQLQEQGCIILSAEELVNATPSKLTPKRRYLISFPPQREILVIKQIQNSKFICFADSYREAWNEFLAFEQQQAGEPEK